MPTTVKTYSAQETMNSYSGTRLSIVNLAGAFDSLPTFKVLDNLNHCLKPVYSDTRSRVRPAR